MTVTTTIYDTTSTSYIPQYQGLNVIGFGNYENATGYVTSDPVYFGTQPNASTAAGTISFTTGSSPSGVYQGYSGGPYAPSPTSNNNAGASITNDFIAAQAGSNINFGFNQTEQYFGALWGSMNASNELQFYKGGVLVGTVQVVTKGNKTDLITTVGGTQISSTQVTAENTYYVSVNISGGYDSVVASTGSGGFELGYISYASSTITANPLTGTGAKTITPYDSANNHPMCFLKGTLIATPHGLRLVETLQPGDEVLTLGGTAEPVRWMGVRKMAARFADKLRAYPVRIAAGALADGIPARDLLLSPEHAVLVEDLLINAGALVNGVNITREAVMPEFFTYYHIELANHALVFAEGLAAETFVDNADRKSFDNWDTHPDGLAIQEMDLPRAKSVRQIPADPGSPSRPPVAPSRLTINKEAAAT